MERGAVDWEKIREVLRPVERVLDYDLEGLKRLDESRRIAFWNEIEVARSAFEEELATSVPQDLRKYYLSKFSLAKLLLAAASVANGEDNIMASSFSPKEIELIVNFERFNGYDIRSPKEIAEGIARRNNLFDLVREIYEKHYNDLDQLLDDPHIMWDLKLAFKRRYERRLELIKEGVKLFVEKYGPIIVVKQVEESLWRKIKEAERFRKGIVAELREKLAEISSLLEKIPGENEVDRRLSILQEELPTARWEERESQELGFLKGLLELERELHSRLSDIRRSRERLSELERDLLDLLAEAEREGKEEVARLIASELNELQMAREDLLQKEELLEAQKEALAAKREQFEGGLEQLREILEGKSVRYVTAADARLAERNFIARFDAKMQRLPLKLRSPLDGRIYTVKYWGPEAHTRSEVPSAKEGFPRNESSKYIVSEKKHRLFGERVPRLVIEAVSLSHLEELRYRGFDLRRANLGELLALLSERIRAAEKGSYFHVVGVASPTGWDVRLLEELSSGGFTRRYLSPNLAFCLVDSVTGEIFHSPADERIRDFLEFFELEFDEEKILKLVEEIKKELAECFVIGLEDFIGEKRVSRDLALSAFHRAAEEGVANLCFLKGEGPVLERRKGV